MQILKEKYKPLYKNLNLIPYLLKNAFYFANIAKKNNRHLLLVGKQGTGVTQVAKWF